MSVIGWIICYFFGMFLWGLFAIGFPDDGKWVSRGLFFLPIWPVGIVFYLLCFSLLLLKVLWRLVGWLPKGLLKMARGFPAFSKELARGYKELWVKSEFPTFKSKQLDKSFGTLSLPEGEGGEISDAE